MAFVNIPRRDKVTANWNPLPDATTLNLQPFSKLASTELRRGCEYLIRLERANAVRPKASDRLFSNVKTVRRQNANEFID
jgi:hypothetical protein